MERSPSADKQKASPQGKEGRGRPQGSGPASCEPRKPVARGMSHASTTAPKKPAPRPPSREPGTGGPATRASRLDEKRTQPPGKIPASSREKAKPRKEAGPKRLSPLAHTRMLAKKAIRNVILYPVAIVTLYPVLVFRHSIYLLVLYLFIWANIVLAVAIFLDEWLDLPRKKEKPPRRRRIFASRDREK